jgi:hypothetical protein
VIVEAQVLKADEVSVVVNKRDLMDAWKALEKLVASLGDMGRFHGVPLDRQQTAQERLAMLEDLSAFVSPEFLRELARARQLLGQYLPDEETEHESEHVIAYWTPREGKRQE